MKTQNTRNRGWLTNRSSSGWLTLIGVLLTLLLARPVAAQSKGYARKKAASPKVEQPAAPAPSASAGTAAAVASPAPGTTPAKDSDKLDIQELEQKYWAPKDTDFSVVQNRTYTKAKRYAVSALSGPLVNDPFNSGMTYGITGNYYFDERYGVEVMLQKSDLTDSKSISDFRKGDGGGLRPDFNRDLSFYGVGFNYVPFYAKMSFLGKKIIYFDMQVTPFLGLVEFEQLTLNGYPKDQAFAYGFDITQYFFFHQNLAVRANLHNRFYKADVLGYKTGTVLRSSDQHNTTMFLMGLTYFF